MRWGRSPTARCASVRGRSTPTTTSTRWPTGWRRSCCKQEGGMSDGQWMHDLDRARYRAEPESLVTGIGLLRENVVGEYGPGVKKALGTRHLVRELAPPLS